MIEGLPNLAFLTLSYAHHHGGGMTDWIAHMAISAAFHAVIYGFMFQLIPAAAGSDSPGIPLAPLL